MADDTGMDKTAGVRDIRVDFVGGSKDGFHHKVSADTKVFIVESTGEKYDIAKKPKLDGTFTATLRTGGVSGKPSAPKEGQGAAKGKKVKKEGKDGAGEGKED